MREHYLAFLIPFSAQLRAVAATASNYTWPSDTDFLEQLLYEQVGEDIDSPAAIVAPCGITPFGKGRVTEAEWIRTAYHDMATADVEAGTGGLDASIGFELDRPENPGRPQFEETLFFMTTHLTSRSSMADLIALGAVLSAGTCANMQLVIPYRAGRIDATEAGPKGVPEPQDTLESHTSAFKRQGFTETEMIGLVACGHTLGGVHGVDFPTIIPNVPVNDTSGDHHTQNFDNSTLVFDNSVAMDFVEEGQQNPLAFGHNKTTRSDERIFGSDGKKEITKMATSSDYFFKTCTKLMERMVNTVPKTVQLTEPIEPIELKPVELAAEIKNNGTMTFSGRIRVVDKISKNLDKSVKLTIFPRSGDDCTKDDSCIVTEAIVDQGSWIAATSGPFPTFKKARFAVDIPSSQGISGFTVAVTDKVDGEFKTITYDNNGKRFPFDDSVLPQHSLSCWSRESGLLNLTVAARNDLDKVTGEVEYPSPPDSFVPSIKTDSVEFTKTKSIEGTNYSLYNVQHHGQIDKYRRVYNVFAANKNERVENLFNLVAKLPSCPN